MFAEIGALWVDHVAVTTDRFEETAQHYLSLPNARILRGPGWNAAQEVHFLFVSFGGDLCIEILGLPSEGSSPISGHVASGAGAYHLCHAVRDLDVAISAAEARGCAPGDLALGEDIARNEVHTVDLTAKATTASGAVTTSLAE